MSEKGTNSLTLTVDGLSVGHYWVGRTKEKERKKLMNERLSEDERRNTLACLSRVWVNRSVPRNIPSWERWPGWTEPPEVDYNEKIPEVDWVD